MIPQNRRPLNYLAFAVPIQLALFYYYHMRVQAINLIDNSSGSSCLTHRRRMSPALALSRALPGARASFVRRLQV